MAAAKPISSLCIDRTHFTFYFYSFLLVSLSCISQMFNVYNRILERVELLNGIHLMDFLFKLYLAAQRATNYSFICRIALNRFHYQKGLLKMLESLIDFNNKKIFTASVSCALNIMFVFSCYINIIQSGQLYETHKYNLKKNKAI